ALNVAYGFTDASRFLEGARAVARLCHPQILPILDLGLADGRRYFTTPLIPSRSLRDLVDREPLVDPMAMLLRAAAALVSVGRAVDYSRRHGVVLEQIGPHDIYIGDDPEVVFLPVTEIGFEIDIDGAPREEFGHVLGYPAYVSPEHVRGSPGPP